jgi:hypothetical protein
MTKANKTRYLYSKTVKDAKIISNTLMLACIEDEVDLYFVNRDNHRSTRIKNSSGSKTPKQLNPLPGF